MPFYHENVEKSFNLEFSFIYKQILQAKSAPFVLNDVELVITALKLEMCVFLFCILSFSQT